MADRQGFGGFGPVFAYLFAIAIGNLGGAIVKTVKLLILVLVAVLLSTPAFAASILLYDHNTTNSHVQSALTNLGLAFTVGNSASFDGLLTGSAWDLVIMDVPSTGPGGGTGNFTELINYITGGGSTIMSYWTLESMPALEAAFDAESATDFTTPQDVYSWDAGHPIWAGVAGPLDLWTNQWSDDGDELALPSFGVALGGFTPGAGTADMAAIILSGNTLYNGFLFDEIGIDSVDGIRLIENEITFMLDGRVPEPGTILLLSLGLAGIAVRRNRR